MDTTMVTLFDISVRNFRDGVSSMMIERGKYSWVDIPF